jgi:AICAR transformylase/IMP cyclohydrolase PurH
MHTASEYHALAEKAYADALEYYVEAVTAAGVRKQMLLKWAENREQDGDFYESRAEIAEDVEARKSHREAA